ncbi:type II secretion system protein J [Pseudoxanthomonas koreensis]|uniref:PulJ/GspJ family protein n=1 Tax=Pseudoxanthomonas koreensis TaxID=266061 RepID=UPI0035A6278D
MARRAAGLTLLEMLVVLIIAGMALAIGFQSLGQWRRADAAINGLNAQTRQATLARSWLESSVRALVPVEDEEFSGDATGFAGVTLQPLLDSQGGATPVTWKAVSSAGVVRLELDEAGHPLVLPLDRASNAEFAYLDKEGRFHPQWPPALGLHDHLPSGVVLRLDSDTGQQRLWSARIVGIRNPIRVLYEPDDDY